MIIVENLKQGSDDWKSHRTKHLNASDAPAMMGLSSYKSRDDLLNEKKTGMQKEVDAHTQIIFDRGHKFEAMAREIIELKLGEDLYPVTVSSIVDGMPLSASLDGMDLNESFCFEHKTLNKKLSKVTSIDDLDKQYKVQMQQQMLVSGCSKCLFVASNGTEDGMIQLWYESDGELEKALISGWKQFNIDLENHEYIEQKEPPKTTAIAELPALSIDIVGSVSKSNLSVYKITALEFIHSINTDLQTDDDFSQAELTVKFCANAEKELESVKKQALSQTADIDLLFKTVDELKEELRQKRLTLSKLVKTQKEQIKQDIYQAAEKEFLSHIFSIDDLLKPIRLPRIDNDFKMVMKGKRSLSSMRDAVNTELARLKIEVNSVADIIRANISVIENNEYKFLFNDLQDICIKPQDDFINLVDMRVSQHQKSEQIKADAERERIREEERIKAEREAKAKLDKERQALLAEDERKADQVEAERKAKEDAEVAQQKILDEEKKLDDEKEEKLIESENIEIAKQRDAEKLRQQKEQEHKSDEVQSEKITITVLEYNHFVLDSNLLAALIAHGVDNWGGYDAAVSEFNEALNELD